MSEFLLVHGAMHGGWCWRDVASRLRDAGHTVLTPTLTGQGERAHLLTRSVGISTHVADVVAVAEYEGLSDIVLVLHSYSGVLAGPLAEHLADRLHAIVGIGAFLVEPGECLLDVEPPDVAMRYRDLVGDGWTIPASPGFLDQWGITEPGLRAYVGPRLTDFPFACATDSIHYDPDVLAALPRTYIEHTDPVLASLTFSRDRAVAAGWRHVRLASGHDAMLADPDRTSALLLAAAAWAAADTLTDREPSV